MQLDFCFNGVAAFLQGASPVPEISSTIPPKLQNVLMCAFKITVEHVFVLFLWQEYLLRCKLHRNEPRSLFKCMAVEREQTFFVVFCQYGAFKAHFYRRHRPSSPINVHSGIANVH